MFTNLVSERQNGAYHGAVGVGINLEVTTQLSDALAHSGYAHTHYRFCAVLRIHSPAAIENFQGDAGFLRKDFYLGYLASGMPVNIGQAVLQHARYCEFHL